MNKDVIKVIVVDDNPSAIEGIILLLSMQNNFEVQATFYDGKYLLESSIIGLTDIILMDIEMPVIGGIEAAKLISYKYPKVKMIAVTMYQHQLYLRDILGAGFHGFVPKGMIAENLIQVINDVLDGKRAYPKDLKI